MFSAAKLWLSRYFGLEGQSSAMAELRCGHRCGHISFTDGQNLFVWGGYCMTGTRSRYQAADEIWIYSAQFDTWKCQKCTGEAMLGTSGACCAVVLPYLYVVCGHQVMEGHVSTVKRLHLSNFEWQTVDVQGEAISPRDKFSVWVYQNKIYCFGGYGLDPFVTGLHNYGEYVPGDDIHFIGWNNQLVVFDTETSTWSNPKCEDSKLAPVPRAAHATALLKDKVYLFGGRHSTQRMNDLHCLDLHTLTWSGEIKPLGAVPIGRSWHTLSKIDDDRIFLYGGYSQDQAVLDDGWIFTVSGQCWTQVVEHSGWPRLWHTAVVTNSKDILIFGGCKADILSPEMSSMSFSDKIVKFQMQPSQLCQLSLETVFDSVSPHRWSVLPKDIQDWLYTKLTMQAKWLSIPHTERSALGPHVVTCAHRHYSCGDS